MLVTADLRLEGEALRITAQDVAPLDQAAARGRGGDAHLAGERPRPCRISAPCSTARAHGRGRVVLVPRLDPAQEVEITLPGGFNVSPRLAQALKMVPGVERVEDI